MVTTCWAGPKFLLRGRTKPTCRSLGEELADIAIYVMSLAEMTGVDLQAAVERKLATNAKRVYVTDEASGALVKADPGDSVSSRT